MWTESWLKCFCESCNTINWYCQGDLSDQTGYDYDALKCFKCGKISVFSEDLELGEDCEPSWKLGKENP